LVSGYIPGQNWKQNAFSRVISSSLKLENRLKSRKN